MLESTKNELYTQYDMWCDTCDVRLTLYSSIDGAGSVRDALKIGKYHRIKDGSILCDECYKKYKNTSK